MAWATYWEHKHTTAVFCRQTYRIDAAGLLGPSTQLYMSTLMRTARGATYRLNMFKTKIKAKAAQSDTVFD